MVDRCVLRKRTDLIQRHPGIHSVTHSKARDVAAELLNDPAQLIAHDERELVRHDQFDLAPDDHVIKGIDPRRPHPDEHLIGGNFRNRDVPDRQRPAVLIVLIQNCSFHDITSVHGKIILLLPL